MVWLYVRPVVVVRLVVLEIVVVQPNLGWELFQVSTCSRGLLCIPLDLEGAQWPLWPKLAFNWLSNPNWFSKHTILIVSLLDIMIQAILSDGCIWLGLYSFLLLSNRLLLTNQYVFIAIQCLPVPSSNILNECAIICFAFGRRWILGLSHSKVTELVYMPDFIHNYCKSFKVMCSERLALSKPIAKVHAYFNVSYLLVANVTIISSILLCTQMSKIIS